MRHYRIISDVHLCDVEEHPDGWKAYKQRRFHSDDALATELERFANHGAPDDERILILNGDILDFDLITATPKEPPWPVSPVERRRGLRPTALKSQWKLQQIFADHPTFTAALSRFLAAGNRVVYVIGNHDAELHFPEVRETFAKGLQKAAELQGLAFDPELLQVEPWFYHQPGELYVEHGQQYDFYTSFRYVLHPLVRSMRHRAPFLALPMGNLSNRYLMSQMGYFNPHASDYILNVFRYLSHWLRYYAFSLRRHLALAWVFGSVAVMARLLFVKGCLKRNPPDDARLLSDYADQRPVTLEQVQKLDALKELPITHRLFRLVREFWIDRLALALLMTGGTVALAIVPIPLWIKLMVPLSSFPLLFLLYEWAAHGESIFHIEKALPKVAQEIAKIFPTKLVVFGHTHKPELLPIAEDVTYVNTGTWAPVWDSTDREAFAGGYRNMLSASFDGTRLQNLRLDSLLPLAVEQRRGESSRREELGEVSTEIPHEKH